MRPARLPARLSARLSARLLGLLLAGAALSWGAGAAGAHEEERHEPAAEVVEAALGAAPESPFPADIGGAFALIDQDGRAVTEADFRGRFMLVFFGFARCEGICPVGLERMVQAVDLLGDSGSRVQPVLITVDPENDTPEILAARVAEIHPRLVGLTGTPDAVAAARRAYKVDAKPAGRSWKGTPLIAHGSFLYLMGPDGALQTVLPPVLGPERMADILRRYVG